MVGRASGTPALGIVAALCVATAAVPGSASGQVSDSPSSNSVLAVPYVAQSELLCGGAAIEMTLRYWGERDFRAERFAPLIEPTAAGISTDDLTRATANLGWNTIPFRGDIIELRNQLIRGRPVVTLIQVASGRFHYVTIVGWVDGRLVYHDPAAAAYETADTEYFDRAWAAADRWALLVLPVEAGPVAGDPRGEAAGSGEAADEPREETAEPREEAAGEREAAGDPLDPAAVDSVGLTAASPCAADVRAAVEAARAGRSAEAAEILAAAVESCPDDPLPLRELAALRLREGRYGEARRLARSAWELSSDPDALTLLAAARYLDGDDLAALDTWNALAPLRVDWVNFVGVERTGARRIAARADLGTREPLSAERLRRARRRIAQLPTLDQARIDYAPTDSGRVEIDIAVSEKRRWPVHWTDGVRSVWDALFSERVRAEAAAPLEVDELWTLEWRWESARRRVEVGVEIPGMLGAPGVWRLEGGRERDSFAAARREDRHGITLGFASWLVSRLRIGLFAGWERFSGFGSRATAGVRPTLALDGDRLILRAAARGWSDLGEGVDFARLDLETHWQSNPAPRGLVWRARAGGSLVTSGAPRSLWPGAGEGSADVPLLRAHRLVQGGVIDGPVFGRRLLHGGLEATLWGIDVPVARVGAALFTDLGLAGARPEDAQGRTLQIDAGLGLRIDVAGAGRLRLDLARGLVDGTLRLSAGLERDWEIDP